MDTKVREAGPGISNHGFHSLLNSWSSVRGPSWNARQLQKDRIRCVYYRQSGFISWYGWWVKLIHGRVCADLPTGRSWGVDDLVSSCHLYLNFLLGDSFKYGNPVDDFLTKSLALVGNISLTSSNFYLQEQACICIPIDSMYSLCDSSLWS